ncbi:MAG TPA: hypothetical protein VM577_08225 [Anaerovoracaceae bacterium]|nr:hypothetical protein [Anaerovoracaceae bacterium]
MITVTKYAKGCEEEDYQQETSHAFIKKNGKYYDSESPEGIDNWEGLGYFKREAKNSWGTWYYDVKEHCSSLSFKRYWTFKKHSSKADKRLLLKLKEVSHELCLR